jgi:hypothetical protein
MSERNGHECSAEANNSDASVAKASNSDASATVTSGVQDTAADRECCKFIVAAKSNGPNGIAAARMHILSVMRQLGDIKFDGKPEVFLPWNVREKRCAENKASLAKALLTLMQLTELLEGFIRSKIWDTETMSALYDWTSAITNLWRHFFELHRAFTWLERAFCAEERRVAIGQIRWAQATMNEEIGKCNTLRSKCIASIACDDHAHNLPIFGTLCQHSCDAISCVNRDLCEHKYKARRSDSRQTQDKIRGHPRVGG